MADDAGFTMSDAPATAPWGDYLFELTRLTAVFESRGGYRGLSSE